MLFFMLYEACIEGSMSYAQMAQGGIRSLYKIILQHKVEHYELKN